MTKCTENNLQDPNIISESSCNVKNEKGQVFVEFIFLFILLLSMAFVFLRLMNDYIGDRWTTVVKEMATPHEASIELQ